MLVFRFLEFEIINARREIVRDGDSLPVEPKVYDLWRQSKSWSRFNRDSSLEAEAIYRKALDIEPDNKGLDERSTREGYVKFFEYVIRDDEARGVVAVS